MLRFPTLDRVVIRGNRTSSGAFRWLVTFNIGVLLAWGVHAQAEEEGNAPPSSDGSDSYPPKFLTGTYEPLLSGSQRARVVVSFGGLDPAARGRFGQRTTARIDLDVDNRTDGRLELLHNELWGDWAEEARVPNRGSRAKRVEGKTRFAPGERGKVGVVLPLGSMDPERVHIVRLRWSLRSDAGTTAVLHSVFMRDRPGPHSGFHFLPVPDPYGRMDIGSRFNRGR